LFLPPPSKFHCTVPLRKVEIPALI